MAHYYRQACAARNAWQAAGAAALRNGLLERLCESGRPGAPVFTERAARAAALLRGLPEERFNSLLASYFAQLPAYDRPEPPAKSGFYISPYETVTHTEAARLLCFPPQGNRAPKRRRAFFITPSFINAAYILDFLPERSFIRFLTGHGYYCYVAEPKTPSFFDAEDPALTDLSGYAERSLLPAAYAAKRFGGHRELIAVGHCLGGPAALRLSRLMAGGIRQIVLFSAPWRFATVFPAFHQTLIALADTLALPGAPAAVSGEQIRAMFALAMWPDALRAGARPGRPPDEQERLRGWLDSGNAVSAALFREIVDTCIRPRHNTAHYNAMRRKHCYTRAKVHILTGVKDKIVPPSSALPGAYCLPDTRVRLYGGGHIGMMTDPEARSRCWAPLLRAVGEG